MVTADVTFCEGRSKSQVIEIKLGWGNISLSLYRNQGVYSTEKCLY